MPYTDEDVRSARETLGTLWPLLRPGLWHSTLSARYDSILEEGAIRPDGGRDGNVYKGSFAASMNAVSLFDFENATEDDTLGFFKRWCSHLWPNEDVPLTIWIKVNRDLLPGRVILAREGGELALAASRNWYPRVEACHIGPILADTFDGVLAISTTHPCKFETLGIGDSAQPRLHELAGQWRKPTDEHHLLIEILRAARAREDKRLSNTNSLKRRLGIG